MSVSWRTCSTVFSANSARTSSIRARWAASSQVEDLCLGGVDEADPGARQHQRPGVRILAVGRRRRVHHRRDPAGDQLLGRDPVDVHVVDHGHVARLQPLHQVLRAPAEPRRALDRDGVGPGSAATPEQGGQAATTGGCHALRLCDGS
jgi:hypothetical protein